MFGQVPAAVELQPKKAGNWTYTSKDLSAEFRGLYGGASRGTCVKCMGIPFLTSA